MVLNTGWKLSLGKMDSHVVDNRRCCTSRDRYLNKVEHMGLAFTGCRWAQPQDDSEEEPVTL